MDLFFKYFGFFLLAPFLTIGNHLNAQFDLSEIEEQINIIEEFYLNYELDSCLHYNEILYNKLDLNDPNNYKYVSEIQLISGNAYLINGQYKAALSAYKTALSFNEKDSLADIRQNIALNTNIGILLTSMGEYRQAEKILSECLISFSNNSQQENLLLNEIKILLALSALKGEQRKYEEEKVHLEQALEIVKHNDIPWESINEVYLGLAINSGDLNDFTSELEYAVKAEKLMEQNANPNDPNYPRLYTTLANSYSNNKLYNKSLDYHHRCVSNYLNYYDDNHPELSIPYENMATCYLLTKKYSLAHKYINKAIKIHKTHHEKSSSKFGQAYIVKLRILESEQNYDLISQTVDTAFQQLAFSVNSKFNFKDIDSPYLLVELLNISSNNEVNKYEITQDSNYLNKAYLTNKISLDLIDSIDLYQIDDSEMLNSKDQLYNTYENAFKIKSMQIGLSKGFKHISELINIVEKSKNALINKSFQDELVKLKGGVPEKLIDEINLLKSEYSNLLIEKQYSQSDNERQSLNNKLYELKKSIWAKREKISNIIAENQLSTEINNIEDEIKEDELLIQYALFEKSMIINAISHDTIISTSQNIPVSFSNDIMEFVKMLRDPNTFKCKELIFSSQRIYNILIPKEVEYMLNKVNNLIIAPSGIINILPFEALVREKESSECHNQSFLINHLNINYLYSLNRSDIVKKNAGSFIGFAPILTTASNSLPGSFKEIAEIAKDLNGDYFTGKDASENKLKASFDEASILHIATHSNLNDLQPMLSFLEFNPVDKHQINDQLYAIEIWNSKINADLVVLSSCSTAEGKIQQGEGVLSLGRSFINAGVSSLLLSLWEVADNSTSQLMIDFYKHLKLGKTTSEALRASKLDWYYSDKIPKSMKHPYYWLGFIHIGNSHKIDINTKKNNHHNLLIFSSLIVLLIFLLKKYYLSD